VAVGPIPTRMPARPRRTQAGNGVAGSGGGDGTTIAADPDADRVPHEIAAEGSRINVVETSGIAEAEASGKVGTDADYEEEQKQPGAG
jgi:hypothetical protein